MKNIVKKIMVCVMLVVGFTLVSACGNNDNDGGNNSSSNIDTSGENIIPTFESFEIVKENSENLSFEQKQSIKTTLSSNNSNNYFGENKKSIEEKIDEEIELGEKIAIDCTVEANEYIYAITKIKNPSNKTITSITINNTRYASSLFENDSTNKRIVIKLNVGTKFRIQNYTLEKIKYIDNGAKDIIINGNVQKLVKVGNLLNISHELNNLIISSNSMSFNFTLNDISSIISSTKGTVTAILYDGDNTQKKEIITGSQAVIFNNLKPGTKYQYAIVATYDKLDGNGKKNYILEKDGFTTDSILEDYTITKNNIINGSIMVPGSAKQGDTITVTVTPNTGYQLDELYYIEENSSAKITITNKQFIMPASNITIYATFKEVVQENKYNITVEGDNGTLNIVSKANAGDLVEFTPLPNNGYSLSLVYYVKEGLDPEDIDNCIFLEEYSFIMPDSNITIYAIFEEELQEGEYRITLETENGTLNIASKANAGDLVEFTPIPDNGYTLFTLFYIEEGLDPEDSDNYVFLEDYSFIMPASNIIIVALFVGGDFTSYTVTTAPMINGAITVNENCIAGSSVSVEVTPNEGYRLESLYYIENGSTTRHEITKDITGYSFTMPENNITIYATFIEISEDDYYTITVNEVINGTFNIASKAMEGDYIPFTVTPNNGYKLSSMYYKEEGSDTSIVFDGNYLRMPANNITIYVTFKKAYTITVDNIENGEISVEATGYENELITIEATPNNGYKLKDLYYIEEGNNTKQEITNSAVWGLNFRMPASNITIYAIFERIQSSETIIINNKEDLIRFANTEEDWNKSISLMENIDLNGAEWTPIGNSSKPFEGIFNGNGYTISNFKITNTELSYIGFFGYVESATIKNLKVSNYSYRLNFDLNLGDIYVGGLAGNVKYGSIQKSYSSGEISMSGDITAIIGGLIGSILDTHVENCYTNGNITATLSGYYTLAGGLIGNIGKANFNSQQNVEYCYSTTNISITNIDEDPGTFTLIAGGLVGSTELDIYNSYATGNINVVSNNFPEDPDTMYSIAAGGLIGATSSFPEIEGYELNTQDIFATNSEYTEINNDATKYTLNEILNKINNGSTAWDSEIWNISLTENPTLK